jgi:HEAT repeats
MSARMSCPHCHRHWIPGSNAEAASPVCLNCRTVPAACRPARSANESTARGRAVAPSPAPATAPTGRAGAWPIVAIAAAGLVLVLLLFVAGMSALMFLGGAARKPAPVLASVPPTAEEPTKFNAPIKPTELGMPKVETKAEVKRAVTPEPILEIRLDPIPDPVAAVEVKADYQTEEPPMPRPFKRIRPAPGPDELIRDLYKVKEIVLEHPFSRSVKRELIVHAARHRTELPQPAPPIFDRADLAGLPLRMGMDCHLGKESAEALQFLSRKLRTYMSESTELARGGARNPVVDTRLSADRLRSKLKSDGDQIWAVPEAVPTLVQMLQVEGRPIRLLLVEMLSQIKCHEATRAIAQRATFDVSEDVREAAVMALRGRRAEEVREALLFGMRYPWPAAAEFAAEAFVNLRDKSHVPALVKLLDKPDPAAPFLVNKASESDPYIREIVRVNHLHSCMMCHPPALNENDLVRAQMPNPNLPLASASSPDFYGAGSSSGSMFVRADITYLKQDFAVPQAVADPGRWPLHQRYDYFVRVRPQTFEDLPTKTKRSSSYPQKDAVLFALRELTGEDHGDTTADWQKYLQGAGAKKN